MKTASILAFLVFFTTVAYSSTIAITAEDAGNGRLSIGYIVVEGIDRPAAFSFYIGLSNGATIDDVLFASPLFPFCPESVVFDPTTGDIVDYGTPVINNTVEMAIRVLPRQSQGPADLDGDGFIGNWDAAIFASYWDSQGPSPADLDGDGHVNMADYGILAGSDPAVGDFGEILLLQLAPGVDNMTAVSISGHSGQDGIVGNGGVLVDVVLPGETWVVVPEPATLLLLALGSFALKRRA